jgi:predicted PurR-regulated permease PerM
MDLSSKPFTLDRVVRIGFLVGVIWALVWLMKYLSDVLIPFAVALLLAYLINPLVVVVQKKIRNRVAAVFISLLTVLAAATLVGWLVAPLIVEEVSHTGKVLSNLVNNSDMAAQAANRLPSDLWQAVKEIAGRREVQELFNADNIWKVLEVIARKVLPGVWGLITGTASFVLGLVGVVIIILYLVFLLLDYQRIRQGWKELIPPPYREAVVDFITEFDGAMNRYFRAQAAVASIVGVIFAVGFFLIGLPLGILLGLFIGLLNMVPYLQLLGLIPAVLVAGVHAVETGSSFWMVLGLTGLVFVVAQLIQDGLLVPRIMGQVTGLSPAMILLSLSIWGKLLGILGLIIALPMTCLLLAYYRRFVSPLQAAANP